MLFFFRCLAHSTHSKHKRPQLRAAQNRYRKQKSLLGHLKGPTTSSNVPSPVIEELPTNEFSTDSQTTTTNEINSTDLSQPAPIPLPGSDRQTRGFRVHIEPKTHTVTRTNKKQKSTHTNEQKAAKNIKQEPVEINNNKNTSESSSFITQRGLLIIEKMFFEISSFVFFSRI